MTKKITTPSTQTWVISSLSELAPMGAQVRRFIRAASQADAWAEAQRRFPECSRGRLVNPTPGNYPAIGWLVEPFEATS